MQDTTSIRDVRTADQTAWRHLWEAYNRFYEMSVPDAVSSRTWTRLLDPSSPILGRVVAVDGAVGGFSHCVLHDGTWVQSSICYLEDLFVDPGLRGRGLGRMLINDVVERARRSGWASLYWHTRERNPARKLYDEFGKADDFVRYSPFLA